MNHQRGYILFLTFSMLAACVALVSLYMLKGITHKRLTFALLEQNELSIFAFSTPSLAQSFLAFSADQAKGVQLDATKNEDAHQVWAKRLLEKVLPVVNKRQSFNLKEIDPDLPLVSMIIFSESGKININGLYDFANKKFHHEGVKGKDLREFAVWLFDRIAVLTEKPSLFGPFVEHLKTRIAPFNDVTELLAIKEFQECFSQAVFYNFDFKHLQGAEQKSKIFLTDIFTVSSEHDRIQPWLLSPSCCALLDIQQPNNNQEDFAVTDKEDKKIDISSFKVQADWNKDWDLLLKPVYKVSFDKIAEPVRCMFANQFVGTVFSVIIQVKKQTYGGDNSIEMKIFALLKEKKLADDSVIYEIIKIYQV